MTIARDKPRRRSYQFSISTLLVVMTLICMGLSPFSLKYLRSRNEHARAEQIYRAGGRTELGENGLYLVAVHWASRSATDDDLALLEGLIDLKTLTLACPKHHR